MALRAKRLKGLKMTEVSGVDAPAHLAPGFLIMKAAAHADRPLTAEESEFCIAIEKAVEAAEEESNVTTSTLSPETVDRIVKEWLDPVHRIEKAADAMQAAEPALDRASAILKAVDADPELGQRYVEAMQQVDQVEKADVDPAWAALEAKADQLQQAAPAMDRPTAIVKAADIWPDLAQAASGG